jgi:hypothetical protein
LNGRSSFLCFFERLCAVRADCGKIARNGLLSSHKRANSGDDDMRASLAMPSQSSDSSASSRTIPMRATDSSCDRDRHVLR